MSDHDYYSKAEIRTATNGLRTAAKNWHGFADTMSTVSSTTNGLHLPVSAFAVLIDGPVDIATATALQSAYDAEFTKLSGLFREAVQEFESMGHALKENADWYDDVDARTAQSFDGIAKGDFPHRH